MLWETLEENYIYFPLLEEQGINIESLKETTRQQLKNRITDINGFYHLLDSMFGKLQYFDHLCVLSPDDFTVYQSYYNSQYTDSNGWQKCLQNPQTQAIYEYLQNSPTTSATRVNSYPEVEVIYDNQRKAVTFIIVTFDNSVLERDKDFINEYLPSLGNVDIAHIIFDISGNVGGSDYYWINNIVAPFGGNYEWTDWWYLRDTEMTRSYFFDDLAPEPIGIISNHTLPMFVDELGLTHYIKLPRQLSTDATLDGTVLDARRWVIIDDKVYSSADSFSAFCKATGWATLVGQSTHGGGQGTSPILISLSNTGLLVRFGGIAVETPDGSLNTVTGIKPAIQIIPLDENSRDALNRLIDGEFP